VNAATRHRLVVTVLAVLLGLRCALGPYRALAGQPAALFFPPALLSWLSAVPSAAVVGGAQVVGVAAATAAAVLRRRRRVALAVAWLALLFLAGLRTSLGKVLHNDVLLLLVTVPFLLAPDDEDDEFALRSAVVVVAGAYFFAGFHKLVHSGLEWVASDNMRWILYAGARSTKPLTPDVALFVADRAWLATLSAGLLLGLEVAFLAVPFVSRLRPVFAVSAVLLHVGTYFALGLDYWLYVAVVPLVLLSCRRPIRVWRAGVGPVDVGPVDVGPVAPDPVPPEDRP
jgi:hypothetical protein